MAANQSQRIQQISDAFQNEDPPFEVHPDEDVFRFQGKIGIRAHNQSACHQAGRTKKAYYVEGSPHEMGYLLGRMAEPEVERMCTEFNDRVIFEFVNVKFRNRKLEAALGNCLEVLLYWLSANIYPDIPDDYKQELEGILDGCRAANPHTKVNWADLWVLNVGVDALLSYVYTGGLPVKKALPLKIAPRHLAIPLKCNGFAVFGPAVQDNGHFLGRDFMFPTAGVFEDTACLIVQNPEGDKKQPFVNMTAPGMIGCIAGMNVRGLGVGVDMSPAGNCDPSRPGFNSMLLARYSIEHGQNCDQAVQIMEDAQRGVSWLYILADGTHQKACVVEAGCSTSTLDPLSCPPDRLKESLPDEDFLRAHPSAEFRDGLMVRWSDYQYPDAYLGFNEALFAKERKAYDPADFAEKGYIATSWKDKSCPQGYYFAPQREKNPHLVLVTNMCLIPEMRLFAMHPWTNLISASYYDDVQWRYDELNHRLLTRLSELSASGEKLTLEDAKEIIDFLDPCDDFPDYYNPPPERPFWRRWLDRLRGGLPGSRNSEPQRGDCQDVPILGSVSVMDLQSKRMHSRYGYYGDGWVQITLPQYVTRLDAD